MERLVPPQPLSLSERTASLLLSVGLASLVQDSMEICNAYCIRELGTNVMSSVHFLGGGLNVHI